MFHKLMKVDFLASEETINFLAPEQE